MPSLTLCVDSDDSSDGISTIATILVLVKSLTQLVTVNAILLLYTHLKMLTVLVRRLLNISSTTSRSMPSFTLIYPIRKEFLSLVCAYYF